MLQNENKPKKAWLWSWASVPRWFVIFCPEMTSTKMPNLSCRNHHLHLQPWFKHPPRSTKHQMHLLQLSILPFEVMMINAYCSGLTRGLLGHFENSHFHSNMHKLVAANDFQDHIKSFSSHGWRKKMFSWQKNWILVFCSHPGISDFLLELAAIRFPFTFFCSNILPQCTIFRKNLHWKEKGKFLRKNFHKILV